MVETLVDNEIAVENLKKMADQKGYKTTSEKLEEGKYRVCIIVENVVDNVEKKDGDGGKFCDCTPEKESNKVVVIRSSVMGLMAWITEKTEYVSGFRCHLCKKCEIRRRT